MILVALILIPFLGGILAWILSRRTPGSARVVSLLTLLVDLAVALVPWIEHAGQFGIAGSGPWLVTFYQPWIPRFGISINLALDGLSLVLVLLTAVLGIVAVVASWNEITQHVGLFYFNLLWALAATTGVFLALDLFLFYFFWELMLVPMFFLIALWGEAGGRAAAIKFFVFTQVGGLLMLIAAVGLYVVHGQATGIYTFNYLQLLGTPMPLTLATWLMLGFFVGFAVKIPLVPVHSWLPDAYTRAPTAGTIVIAGLMAKTGAYGLLRFAIPLFPAAAARFAPVAMALAVIGLLYGAIVAFGQTDAKRALAYASLSHMGLIVLGVFAWTQIALQGAVIQMVCHGIILAALFTLIGALDARIHTRDLRQASGLWAITPRMGGVALLFALALMGLPGLGSFIGEFLVLLGTFPVRGVYAIVAALGVIAAAVYALWLIQHTFQGENRGEWQVPDLSVREMGLMAALIVVIVGIGLYPQPVIDTIEPSLSNLRQATASTYVVERPPSGGMAEASVDPRTPIAPGGSERR